MTIVKKKYEDNWARWTKGPFEEWSKDMFCYDIASLTDSLREVAERALRNAGFVFEPLQACWVGTREVSMLKEFRHKNNEVSLNESARKRFGNIIDTGQIKTEQGEGE